MIKHSTFNHLALDKTRNTWCTLRASSQQRHWVKFEDIKEVIRSRKLKNDRQCNGQNWVDTKGIIRSCILKYMYIIKLNKKIELHPGQNMDPAKKVRTRMQDTWCSVAFWVENLQEIEKKIVYICIVALRIVCTVDVLSFMKCQFAWFSFFLKSTTYNVQRNTNIPYYLWANYEITNIQNPRSKEVYSNHGS